jgi:hypothetical protein
VSTNSQLEFLTLLGIILNGIMTGYVTQNTIYRFLVENIYTKLYAACGGLKIEDANDESFKEAKLYQYHAQRIQSTLDQIAFY